jgi:hypothetical protein
MFNFSIFFTSFPERHSLNIKCVESRSRPVVIYAVRALVPVPNKQNAAVAYQHDLLKEVLRFIPSKYSP